MQSEEVNYKKDFCEKYFDKGTWDLDVLNQVDVLLKDRKNTPLLYIESKFKIPTTSENLHEQALAQVILTNKKQTHILSRVALIFQDENGNDILELLDCAEDSVMYNNDINWKAEKPSLPTKDAIERINDRLKGKITRYENAEIKEFYKQFKEAGETLIEITEKNFNVVYNQWKNEIKFYENIDDEQDLINLFLVDVLNGTKYELSVSVEINGNRQVTKQPLIREGTNLSHYKMILSDGVIDGIRYSGGTNRCFSSYYTISDAQKYNFFWKKYKRPPEKNEFLKILERSATLYSEKYRRDTGGEYTPICFVEKQNEILLAKYNLDNFIVMDPCAGVGNLENQFGKDFKQFCYLSTLEQMDVDTCKIKGFENTVQFDYLKNDEHPIWKYKGDFLSINDICKRENRKLMIIMNPPYQKKAGFKNDLAIEFFNKVLSLKPDVIVYYCKTEFFLRTQVNNFVNHGYSIVSHIFSNAKETFKLSEWSVSQIIFEKAKDNVSDTALSKYDILNGDFVTADRYEVNPKTEKLDFIKTYTYDNKNPDLIKEIEKEIKQNNTGMILGQWCYLKGTSKNYEKRVVKYL